VRNTAEGISQGKFEPKPGFACKWCAYSILCPATAEKISTDRPAAAAGGV
jgi:hypothetical protein